MQRLVTDKSSAFRSHPLFPLLRDLIIADMNFHEPSFPHQLIRDLPSDFNKLLKVADRSSLSYYGRDSQISLPILCCDLHLELSLPQSTSWQLSEQPVCRKCCNGCAEICASHSHRENTAEEEFGDATAAQSSGECAAIWWPVSAPHHDGNAEHTHIYDADSTLYERVLRQVRRSLPPSGACHPHSSSCYVIIANPS